MTPEGYARLRAEFMELLDVERPKIVIGLVVDQMRWDYLYRYYDRYSNNGFKRLLRNGYFRAIDALVLLAEAGRVVLVDVRAQAPGAPAARLPGARHLDLGALQAGALAGWPEAAEFITYCACPNDASAVKAAQWLQQQGRRARVLRGGIEAWTAAGFTLEAVPCPA